MSRRCSSLGNHNLKLIKWTCILVKRTDVVDWNEYDALVVSAASESDALTLYAGFDKGWLTSPREVTYLGVAEPNTRKWIVLASFTGS